MNKSADMIADWQKEANQFRAESNIAKARNAVIDHEIAELALPFKQGQTEAIAQVQKLRAERAANLDLIELNDPAIRKLESMAAAELNAEQTRLDRHLRRKTVKQIEPLAAHSKDLQRGLDIAFRAYRAMQETAEAPRIAWRSTWPAMPGILLDGVLRKALSHALFSALRNAGIGSLELRFSEDVAQFNGLHQYFSMKATDAKNRLLNDGPAVIIEDPLDEPEPAPDTSAMPVKLQQVPHVWTDAEIAAVNADGTAQDRPDFALSGRDYIKQRDHGNPKQPTIAEGIDFDPI